MATAIADTLTNTVFIPALSHGLARVLHSRSLMKSRITFPRVITLCAALACLVSASPSSAQYFGQNKVQYRPLDFKVMHTEHFDIYFYPEEQAGTEIAARMAERWYSRLSRALRHQLHGR